MPRKPVTSIYGYGLVWRRRSSFNRGSHVGCSADMAGQIRPWRRNRDNCTTYRIPKASGLSRGREPTCNPTPQPALEGFS